MFTPYYTDPLAAAWMAKHFRMNFHTGGGDFCKFQLHATGQGYREQHFGLNADRWYIHPDSRHLLEPAVLDLCLIQVEGEAEEDTCFLWDLDLVARGIHRVKRIIERDGVAFMWPQSAN